MKSRFLLDSFQALQETFRAKRFKKSAEPIESSETVVDLSKSTNEQQVNTEETQPNQDTVQESRLDQVETSLETKSEPDLVEFSSPTDPILESFSTGKFSDVQVIFNNDKFDLHRIILSQSNYFQPLLTNLETIHIDLKGNAEGLNLALKDLYDFKNYRLDIRVDNAFHVLFWGIKLQLDDLCQYLFELVSSSLYK